MLLYAVEAGRKEHARDLLRLLSDTSCPIVTANGLGRQPQPEKRMINYEEIRSLESEGLSPAISQAPESCQGEGSFRMDGGEGREVVPLATLRSNAAPGAALYSLTSLF